MNNREIRITVFTPTYNRERYLPALFASLCGQTCRDFEWILVDQGRDGTEALAAEFRRQASFPVVYERLEGERGIGRAFNRMLELARGPLVMKVDDDDTLTPDALETVLGVAAGLPADGTFAGVGGLRMYPDGRAIGGEWQLPGDRIDCTNLERFRYGLEGDKAEAYDLEVLRTYGPMPVYPGESYTWEGVLWDRIAHAGKRIRWFNRKIYVTEYLPGGATDNRIRAIQENFRTYTRYVSERMAYRELPFGRRLRLSCRYFEQLRIRKQPLRDVLPSFRGSRFLALLGYAGSAVTGRIPGKSLPAAGGGGPDAHE